MSVRKSEWTTWDFKSASREQVLVDFIQKIIDSEPDFDFDPYKVSLKVLQESLGYKHDAELNILAYEYLEILRQLQRQSPRPALKLMTILVAYGQRAYYPQKLGLAFHLILNELLASECLPRKERIEWGVNCWMNWPLRDKCRDEMVPTLVQLFIQEAQVDPDYILAHYDAIADRGSTNSYIFHMSEAVDGFLQFARLVKAQRPVLLIDCLQRILGDAGRGSGNYHPSEAELRSFAKELFDLSEDDQYAALINHQSICRDLIHYVFPDEPWYAALFQRLWRIEGLKGVIDKRSAHNYAYIALNAPSGHALIAPAQAFFHHWAFNYRGFDDKQPDALIDHADRLLGMINAICHEKHAMLRNKSLPVPESNVLVDDAITAYWQMVDWLQEYYPKFCFYVLSKGLERGWGTVPQTHMLGEQAHQQFVEMFGSFCRQHTADAVDVIAYMIENSRFSSIDVHLYKILDQVYPMLHGVDAKAALRAVNMGSAQQERYAEYWQPGKKCIRPYNT